MISRADYVMGRFGDFISDEVEGNIIILLEAVNGLYEDMAADGIPPAIDAATGTAVASGIRRPTDQERTRAQTMVPSAHLSGEGLDGQDHADRRIARWCLLHPERLAARGLYMEHPQWTSKRNPETGARDPWVHWQTRPPSSGLQVFIPSREPTTAPALAEQAAAGVPALAYAPQAGEALVA